MNSKTFFWGVSYLALLLFVGVGIISVIPPWEGFDETAHYSSMKQIADTRTLPLFGKAKLDMAVENYTGPMPYSSLSPPFDTGLVYNKFFKNPQKRAAYLKEYHGHEAMPIFLQGNTKNWQAQHPPLYYVIMALFVKQTEGMSLVRQMFILRTVSYLMALGGVGFGLVAFRNREIPLKQDLAVWGFMIYPLILPMFFFEFARIGNDALCLLLVGLLTWCLKYAWEPFSQHRYVLASGFVLGIGLLTKAFFFPIGVGLAVWMGLYLVHDRGLSKEQKFALLFRGSVILALGLLVGGGWYFYKLMAFGDFIGGNDSLRLAAKGGLLANIKNHASFFSFARGVIVIFVTYVWAGSWSLVRFPIYFYLPQLALAASLLVAYSWHMKKRCPSFKEQSWLTVWMFFTFGAGLVYHVLQCAALNGNGNTPGWYLHILMPWVAPALGIGVKELARYRLTQLWLKTMSVYAFFFVAIAMWAQFAMFMGCAVKAPSKVYLFTEPWWCVQDIPVLFENLAVTGFPYILIAAYIGGLGSLVAMVLIWRR
nr:hypothetical protein [uncultured Desulfobacter sp.]